MTIMKQSAHQKTGMQALLRKHSPGKMKGLLRVGATTPAPATKPLLARVPGPWRLAASATDPNPLTPAEKDQALIWAGLSTVSMALGAYHGYKRDSSIGWALWWGLMGAMFPVITPTIALAQGFGKKKGR